MERGEESRLNPNDPVVVDLLQRVSRLEARVDALEKAMAELRERAESIDSKTWWILTGVVLSILLQLLMRLLH
jgi:cell division protein ZapA (FtsZ GTPase activity inhibitor)